MLPGNRSRTPSTSERPRADAHPLSDML